MTSSARAGWTTIDIRQKAVLLSMWLGRTHSPKRQGPGPAADVNSLSPRHLHIWSTLLSAHIPIKHWLFSPTLVCIARHDLEARDVLGQAWIYLFCEEYRQNNQRLKVLLCPPYYFSWRWSSNLTAVWDRVTSSQRKSTHVAYEAVQ